MWERPPEVDTSGEVSIEQFDDTWVVEAPWLQRLMANVNFSDYESRSWFDGSCAPPASLTSWRPWASRTGTPSPCTTWSLNISGKANSGRPENLGRPLRLSKKSKDFSDSRKKCRYFPAAARRKSPRYAR